MLRPDLSFAPPPATAPLEAARPLAAGEAGGRASGFGALFAEVQADVSGFIERGSPPGPMAALSAFAPAPAIAAAATPGPAGDPTAGPAAQAFLEQIAPYAEDAGARLGVSPGLVAAHAALESGWGRKPLRAEDGTDTHNLFGIKAGGAWHGDVAQAATTEVEDGVPMKTTGAFRSYPDTASAFRDYAQLLQADPRYRGALNVGGDARAFAQGLARGGYATDPAYADKLSRLAAQVQSRRPE